MKRTMLAVLVVAFLASGLTGCASGPSGGTGEIVYREVRNSRSLYKEPYKGYVLKGAQIGRVDDRNWSFLYDNLFESFVVSEELAPLFAERIANTRMPSGAPISSFTLYISVQPDDPANPEGPQHYQLDKIDGLISAEEASQIVAAQAAKEQQQQEAAQAAQTAQAQREAEREAARKAEEEANRYDPAKFSVVSSDFKPAKYTKADLFTAAAAAEKLEITKLVKNANSAELEEILEEKGLFSTDLTFTPSRKFASEVLFVSQNGTDITFKTADNAITKRMKVDSRTGLAANQRVRIYYSAYRVQDWHIDAIERL